VPRVLRARAGASALCLAAKLERRRAAQLRALLRAQGAEAAAAEAAAMQRLEVRDPRVSLCLPPHLHLSPPLPSSSQDGGAPALAPGDPSPAQQQQQAPPPPRRPQQQTVLAAAATAAADPEAQRARERRAAALLRDRLDRRRALEAKQAAEREEAEAAAREEAERAEAHRAAAAVAAAARAREEMEARAAAARTTDEASRIRAEFAADSAAAESAADAERARQRERTDRALAARQAKRARELARRQEEELAAEEAQAAQAAAALAAEEAAERERAALAAALGTQPALAQDRDAAGATIEAVLQARHTEETGDLIARQYAERAGGLRRALEGVLEHKRAAQLEALARLHAEGAPQSDVDAALAAIAAAADAERAEASARCWTTSRRATPPSRSRCASASSRRSRRPSGSSRPRTSCAGAFDDGEEGGERGMIRALGMSPLHCLRVRVQARGGGRGGRGREARGVPGLHDRGPRRAPAQGARGQGGL